MSDERIEELQPDVQSEAAINLSMEEASIISADLPSEEVHTENVQDMIQCKRAEIKVRGEAFTKIPDDLYIPPDALEVFLEAFEGPLDLLLYLIRRQNLDVLDIPIADITRQYVEYIELMKEVRLELAGEYLVMAAMLAEIKSRMLLPKQIDEEGEEIDPRAELIRRLQEYERFKNVAEALSELPRRGRDTFAISVKPPEIPQAEKPLPDLQLKDLLMAFHDVMKRVKFNETHRVQRETLSVRERMTCILDKLSSGRFIAFHDCFNLHEGRQGVVVTFMAILELFRESVIEVVQSQPFAPIHIKAVIEQDCG